MMTKSCLIVALVMCLVFGTSWAQYYGEDFEGGGAYGAGDSGDGYGQDNAGDDIRLSMEELVGGYNQGDAGQSYSPFRYEAEKRY